MKKEGSHPPSRIVNFLKLIKTSTFKLRFTVKSIMPIAV